MTTIASRFVKCALIGSSVLIVMGTSAHAQYNFAPGPSRSVSTAADGKQTTTTCRWVFGTYECNAVTTEAPTPEAPNEEEQKQLATEKAAREAAWDARCKPTIYVDADGLSRYRYAADNCGAQMLNK